MSLVEVTLAIYLKFCAFNTCDAQEINNCVLFSELPSITSSPMDDREIVEEQMNLEYTCEYVGTMADIDWFFNGQPIHDDSGVSINDNTLTIASPQVSNSGIYQCIVSNDFGDAQAAWLLEIRPSS